MAAGALALALALVLVAVVAWAVAREGDGGTRESISEALGTQLGEAEFSALLPSYLPAGTSLAAEIDDVKADSLIFHLPESPSANVDADQRALVVVDQHPITDGDSDINSGDYNSSIAKVPVYVDRSQGPSSRVWISIFGIIDNVRVTVGLTWHSQESNGEIVLTPRMEDQAFKVFESMIP